MLPHCMFGTFERVSLKEANRYQTVPRKNATPAKKRTRKCVWLEVIFGARFARNGVPGVTGPENDQDQSTTTLQLVGAQSWWSCCGPEILGLETDLTVWSCSGPGRALVLRHRNSSRKTKGKGPSAPAEACPFSPDALTGKDKRGSNTSPRTLARSLHLIGDEAAPSLCSWNSR